MCDVILELDKIGKQYKDGDGVFWAIKDISLKLRRGKIISIIGRSGSGKSSLLHIAGLLDDHTSGNVIVMAHKNPNNKIKNQIRKKHIGFVYQNHYLIDSITVLNNVALPLILRNRPDAKEEAKYLLNKLGMYNKIDSAPSMLSGGEKQRVSIARALITKPEIILADEPTGSLDSKNADAVLDLFLSLVYEYNCGAIIVTHNDKVAERSDVIYRL